ncbi:class B sortase [Paenibacillus sp. y28]|uniref:class B sortase n=1 Tax=Paenibacillus sp. y28 TaxID=3129110 RepID=UPI00301696E6
MRKLWRSVLFQRAMTLVWLGAFLFCAYELASIFIGYHDNREVLAQAQSLYHASETDEQGSGTAASDEHQAEARPRFRALLEINPELVGWLKIDGTVVDYPIVQATDNDYYVTRNYKREESRAGSIFMDFRNDSMEPGKHTVLYGHRMKDETMFGSLKYYMEPEFFQAHQALHLDTLYNSYDLMIFSVYYTTTEFDYIQTEFQSLNEYSSFLRDIQGRSLYKTSVSVTEEDRIVTLSTCDYHLDPVEGRLVVHAKLVERGAPAASNEF